MNLSHLSDQELLADLKMVCLDSRQVLVKLVVYLGEVEARKLAAATVCGTLYDFCIQQLGMSEDEAARRVALAKLIREYPTLLPWLERGDIHLTGFLQLKPYITPANVEDLAARASHKSKREIAEMLASLFPKPPLPARIERVPTQCALHVDASHAASAPPTMNPMAQVEFPRVAPLSPETYGVQFTASAQMFAKITRAKELTGVFGDGQLPEILEEALDLYIAERERQHEAKVDHPLKNPRPIKEGEVSDEVRRQVFERDKRQCTFEDEEGNRCTATTGLEVDHIEPKALGGSGELANVRLRCEPHNLQHAIEIYGLEHVQQKIRESQERARARREAAREKAIAHEKAVFETVTRGLLGMSFRKKEVEDALVHLRATAMDRDPVHLLRAAVCFLRP